LTEVVVLLIYVLSKMKVIGLGFLWLNPIGAFGVILFSLALDRLFRKTTLP
jgi:solute:Na+ symporter, SSS family